MYKILQFQYHKDLIVEKRLSFEVLQEDFRVKRTEPVDGIMGPYIVLVEWFREDEWWNFMGKSAIVFSFESFILFLCGSL